MKKCRKLMPLLVAAIAVLLMTTTAYADSANYKEVPSGSKKAEVMFTIEDVLAFEGTASTTKNNGFKVKSIKAVPSDKTITPRYSDEGDQVVLVGESIPTNIVLTVTLQSDQPMQDGAYTVTLTYGRTNSNGTYNANRKLTAIIYVGISAPDESESSSSKSTLNEQTSSAAKDTTTPEAEVTVTDTPESESNRADVMGMLDLSALRSALEEAEKLKTSGRLDADELALLQDAIDVAEEALSSDRQGAIDDAANALFAVIESLGGPVTDEELEPKKEKSGGGGLILPLILALIAVLGIVGVLMYLRMKKKRRVQYEGAPIVDYEIGDDDLL